METPIMSKLLPAVVVAAGLAVPAASFAQSSQQGLTRAQVRAELIQLEQHGYSPQNPGQFQAAETRVGAAKRKTNDTSGYGTSATGASESGAPAQAAQAKQ
jgi:hypothetical protein